MPIELPPPASSFASDNYAGAHPEVIEAITAANTGPAAAYGADGWTERGATAIRAAFDAPVEVCFTYGGTGANVVGLQTVLRPWEAVICPATAHIHTDECGALERLTGAKLFAVDCRDGKLTPEHIEPFLQLQGDEHHSQPRVVSVTQSTEMGTLYDPDELAALADAAHAHDLLLHVDGARLANAIAALGLDLQSAVVEPGVDVLSFGGTKNGLLYGEAVVFVDPARAAGARFVRKQTGQLASKMRFIGAQFEALLTDDLWLRSAGHANAMTSLLATGLKSVPGVSLAQAPGVNAVFATLPRPAIDRLQAWTPFEMWDEPSDLVRWMTSFATTPDDVERFVAGVQSALDEA